jgi:hypothetical protein
MGFGTREKLPYFARQELATPHDNGGVFARGQENVLAAPLILCEAIRPERVVGNSYKVKPSPARKPEPGKLASWFIEGLLMPNRGL